MEPRLAILAGHGQLPREIAAADDTALFVTFDGGVDAEVPEGGQLHMQASFEKLGALFKGGLREHSVNEVVFAGSMTRPKLNPLRFDMKTARLMPRVMKAMGGGG